MLKERYFTESFDRTHTLMIQVKSKNDKWIDYEKCFSQQGFSPKDYITHFYTALIRLHEVDKNISCGTNVRILNGMRKQVFGKSSAAINELFGGWLSDGYCGYIDKHLLPSFRPFAYDAKIASFRFNNPELTDILITDIETEDGWKKFCKVLQDISLNNDGINTFNAVELSPDDNNLHWYKVKCNSGLQFSFALYA